MKRTNIIINLIKKICNNNPTNCRNTNNFEYAKTLVTELGLKIRDINFDNVIEVPLCWDNQVAVCFEGYTGGIYEVYAIIENNEIHYRVIAPDDSEICKGILV